MDLVLLVYTFFLTFSLIFLTYKFSARWRCDLPPSPAAALPIIGHLHLLEQPLHRTFRRFAQTTGPIFSLKLGVRRCVVVSSPYLVEKCFTENDIALANRPHILVDKYIGYNHRSMVGAPYGELWRSLRRIAAQELLTTARLNGLLHIRKDEMNRLLLSLGKMSSDQGFCRVELRPKLSELTFNTMMRMIAGKSFSGEDEESVKGRKYRKLINDIFEIAQASNPQDFLPFLQWIDFGGFVKRLKSLTYQLDEFLQILVDEHREEKRNTMIGHLLCLQESEPQFCSDHTIKALAMSMLLGGTDTSSVTLEWAMAVLLNHPDVLEKARSELETEVGFHRLINEEDMPNLPYLRNIISETFRLFPAAPLLLPHESSKDCRLGGYDIPRGTLLFVNAWAIHRDPEVWDEPLSFKPERFEGREVEPYKLMPFGTGRRSCPGSGLAQRMVGLVLGSLIQCFEWERVGLEEDDLAEGIGLTMPKVKPLEVMCKPREIMYQVFQELSVIQ